MSFPWINRDCFVLYWIIFATILILATDCWYRLWTPGVSRGRCKVGRRWRVSLTEVRERIRDVQSQGGWNFGGGIKWISMMLIRKETRLVDSNSWVRHITEYSAIVHSWTITRNSAIAWVLGACNINFNLLVWWLQGCVRGIGGVFQIGCPHGFWK